MTNKKRLEEAKLMAEMLRVETRLPYDFPFDLVDWLVEQTERVQKLESFKKSVEYTVDSETLELIISNQNSEHVVSYSETYDEKIFLLQKRVQELESESYNAHLERLLDRREKQNKRYREALEFYANEENYLFDENEYKVGLGVPESEITLDYGNKAREALEAD